LAVGLAAGFTLSLSLSRFAADLVGLVFIFCPSFCWLVDDNVYVGNYSTDFGKTTLFVWFCGRIVNMAKNTYQKNRTIV
jgi:hypothetical protein